MVRINKEVLKQLIQMPKKTGVYVLRDKNDNVIFVNMTENLAKRVRAHFHSNKRQDKIIKSKTHSIEIHIEQSRIEAVKLELGLIQKYHPPLNQRGHDQKKYRFIELTVKHQYPSATVRKLINGDKQVKVLGPYPKKSSIRQIFNFAVNYFEIADCKQRIVTGKQNKTTITCLRRRTEQCCRPCEISIDPQIYNEKVQNFIKFFNGEIPDIIVKLEEQMKLLVLKKEFERAALIRDNIKAIKQYINFNS